MRTHTYSMHLMHACIRMRACSGLIARLPQSLHAAPFRPPAPTRCKPVPSRGPLKHVCLATRPPPAHAASQPHLQQLHACLLQRAPPCAPRPVAPGAAPPPPSLSCEPRRGAGGLSARGARRSGSCGNPAPSHHQARCGLRVAGCSHATRAARGRSTKQPQRATCATRYCDGRAKDMVHRINVHVCSIHQEVSGHLKVTQ